MAHNQFFDKTIHGIARKTLETNIEIYENDSFEKSALNPFI